MNWHDLCERDQDRLSSYETFLSHNETEVILLPLELAAPFPEPVHICGIDAIAQLSPRTSPWTIARRMVEHAWQAAANPDPDQTISTNGTLTLLYTVPLTNTTWAACALQSHWNDWYDGTGQPAHAIYAQHWGPRNTPHLPPRNPAQLWNNQPTNTRKEQ